MDSARIFLIDDERTIRLTFRLALETVGYRVQEAGTADGAMMGFAVERFNLVILDLRIGEGNGLNVLSEMRARDIQTPTLMITAYGNIRQAVRAMQLGAIDFLEKPIEPVTLRQIVADILNRHRTHPDTGSVRSFEDCLREAKRLINLQRFAGAAEEIKQALALGPESPEAHNLQGILHEIDGDYDGARQAYGRAIKRDSQHEAAQQNMRRLYELFNFGNSKEAHHLGDIP